MKYLYALLPVLLLSACDPFGLPEKPADVAVYYVAAGEHGAGTVGSKVPSRIAVEYTTPDGVVRDTLVSPDTAPLTAARPRTLASWSRTFDRGDLPEFKITAENLTPASGFVSVSLLINQKTVAFDTSSVKVELSN